MAIVDIGKFQKTLSKSMSNISFGFKDPSTWIHTGNYALNYRVSGDFKKGFPLEGKMTLLAGESGSGKSFVASGNIAKWCQDNGVLPIIIDTENALDESWMRNFGVNPNGYIMKVSANLIDDIAKTMTDFIKEYKTNYSSVPYDERPKALFIIDSLGMATTNVEVEQVEKGDIKGDMGRKQKQLYSLCRTFMASCATEPIGLLATAHVYASQDMFNPDAKISGGSSLEFTPSVVIAMNKRKLKEDDDGNKTSDVRGIKVDATVRKTRYTQPFQKITFNIPWDTGMDSYSGLFELFSESIFHNGKPILQKEGNQYAYYSLKTNELVFKKFRKAIENSDYDMIMADYQELSNSTKLSETVEQESEIVEE
jgi:RecA/RadA recombinase